MAPPYFWIGDASMTGSRGLSSKVLVTVIGILITSTLAQGVAIFRWGIVMDNRLVIQETKTSELPELLKELKSGIKEVSVNLERGLSMALIQIANNQIEIGKLQQAANDINRRLDRVEDEIKK